MSGTASGNASGSAPGTAAPTRTGAPATAASAATDGDIVTNWSELQPRLHAVYRGRLAVESGEACASDLKAVLPADAAPPARLCTPLLEMVAWHIGHSVGMPTGADLWIATTRDPAGRERVAVASGVWERPAVFGASDRAALAAQFNCGQLAIRWRVPAADLACTNDADCRVIGTKCSTVAVAERAAAPYLALHARWGGTCDDPLGGVCPPPRVGAVCMERICTVD